MEDEEQSGLAICIKQAALQEMLFLPMWARVQQGERGSWYGAPAS